MEALTGELLRKGERNLSDGRNRPLDGRDLWRLIAEAATAHPCRDREERDEIFSRVSVAAAEWIGGDRRNVRRGPPAKVLRFIGANLDRVVPPNRADDRDELRRNLAAVAADELRCIREERGEVVPAGSGSGDPEDGEADGLAVLLAQGERVAVRASEKARRCESRADLPGDPCPPYARSVLGHFTAGTRAAVGAAILPEAHSEEWARGERCKPGTWRERASDGRDRLTPTLAGLVAGLLAGADPDRIPGTLIRVNGRDLPRPLPNGATKGKVKPLPEKSRTDCELSDSPNLAAALTHRNGRRIAGRSGGGDNGPRVRRPVVRVRAGISQATYSPTDSRTAQLRRDALRLAPGERAAYRASFAALRVAK